MTIQDAKSFVGYPVKLSWTGRKGDEQSDVVHVLSVGFIPLYGPCLITDVGEIRLDRVVTFEAVAQRQAS